MSLGYKRNNSFSQDIKDNSKDYKDGICKSKGYLSQIHGGIIMALFCSVFLSVTFLFVRLVKDISPMEFGMLRFVGTLLPSLPIVVRKAAMRTRLVPPGHYWMLLVHACFGTAGVLLYFNAFRYLPLADACVIGMATPVIVLLLAWAIYREPLGHFSIIVVLSTVMGIILISHPHYAFLSEPNTDTYYWGLGSALVGILVQGMALITLRSLREVHFSVTLTIFSLVGLMATTIMTLVWTPQTCIPRCGQERYWFLLIGGLSFGGQLLLTRSLQREYAGPISLVRAVDVLLAYMWQIAFQQQSPSILSIFGGILILLSVVFLAIQRWVIALPDGSPLKRSLRLITL